MNEAKFDALEDYRTSPLFSEAERAALDYVTELTKEKKLTWELSKKYSGIIQKRQFAKWFGWWPASIFITSPTLD